MKTENIIITEFSKPTSEGVMIHLNNPARLKTGTGHFKEFWISWDKIGAALIDGYTDKSEVDDLNNLRSSSQQPSPPQSIIDKAMELFPVRIEIEHWANVRAEVDINEHDRNIFLQGATHRQEIDRREVLNDFVKWIKKFRGTEHELNIDTYLNQKA